MWAQSVYEEAARGRGEATASVLSDLVRAFEQVARHKMWEQRLAKETPRKLLTVALEACAFGGRLAYKDAVSEVAWTLSAMLAGSGFAGDMLFVTPIRGLDEVMRKSEELARGCMLRCLMVVDDVSFVVEGGRQQVSRGIVKVLEETMGELEGTLLMQVSRDKEGAEGKIVAQACGEEVRRRITGGLGRLGVQVKAKVRNFGVNFDAGRGGAEEARRCCKGG